MKVQQKQLIDAIGDALSAADVDVACRAYLEGQQQRSHESRDSDLRKDLATATRAFLLKQSTHSDYRAWVNVFFGVMPGRFRSDLQQPNYLYYPSIPPVPWFETKDVLGLSALRDSIEEIRAEILATMDGAGVFEPYVTKDAEGDALWNTLASNPSWSAIHLLKGGVWNEQMHVRMPRAMAFLRLAPLAEFPPHAPECFVSRLSPGVELPPHYGLSNIKLTAHLPLRVPEDGCSITVAGTTKSWRSDDFLIFDDSFLHSARNLSAQDRTVLIFDVVHPSLSHEERSALGVAIRVLDSVNHVMIRPRRPMQNMGAPAHADS